MAVPPKPPPSTQGSCCACAGCTCGGGSSVAHAPILGCPRSHQRPREKSRGGVGPCLCYTRLSTCNLLHVGATVPLIIGSLLKNTEGEPCGFREACFNTINSPYSLINLHNTQFLHVYISLFTFVYLFIFCVYPLKHISVLPGQFSYCFIYTTYHICTVYICNMYTYIY